MYVLPKNTFRIMVHSFPSIKVTLDRFIRAMSLHKGSYALTVLFVIIPNLSVVDAQGIDYSQCASDVNQIFWKATNITFLRDRYGSPTNNISQAWGISYEACKAICRGPVNTKGYSWNALSEALTSWLLPWLALTAQLPFETKDKQTNLMALLLALGSPSLSTFSLSLTILNGRWINQIFRPVKEGNKGLRPRRPFQTKAIKAARVLLIESQHTPIQIVNGPRREIAQLFVCSKNWPWWLSLRKEIQKTKRGWTYSLYAQIGWVCVSQVLTIVQFFTSASFNTSTGIGLGINSLWIWMIPVILGWVYVGTQTFASSIKAAIASVTVPVLGPWRDLNGECIGIRDRAFDESYKPFRNPRHFSLGPTLMSQSSQTRHRSEDISLEDVLVYSQPVGATPDPEQQLQSLLMHACGSSLSSCVFLGFSIAGCEREPGPIFNFARIWSHMNAVRHVAKAFLVFTRHQKEKRTVNGQPWNDELGKCDENLNGSPEEQSKYISENLEDVVNFSIHGSNSSQLVLNCIAAAFVAIFLQWGSTGAAMVIAYK